MYLLNFLLYSFILKIIIADLKEESITPINFKIFKIQKTKEIQLFITNQYFLAMIVSLLKQ